MAKSKIQNLESLKNIIFTLKKNKKRIILCHGVFDLLHIGHIKYFEEAKKLGDILVVTITPDEYVNKGPNRPVFNSNLRSQALASLEFVDFVSINKWPTAVNTIKLLKPDIYFKGKDYKKSSNDLTGMILKESSAIKAIKGKILFSDTATYSSSSILNSHGFTFDKRQLDYINKNKKILKNTNLNSVINQFKKIKILCVGETIIDEYTFAEALGKSGKEPVLAMRNLFSEKYAGGVLAIANHLNNFSKNITVLSVLGEKNEHKEFIKSSLGKNIKSFFINKKNSPTITKKRILDNLTRNKVIGIYSINDDPLNENDEKKFTDYLEKNIKNYDVVIISDYGHGFISEKNAKILSNYSKFSSLNAQINASNVSFSSIDKYRKIDCLIINEGEIRHHLRDKDSKIESLMKVITKKIGIKKVIVTRGVTGLIYYNSENKQFVEAPAFTSKVIDKVGAGDAVLAILSICLKMKVPIELSLLIGSLAAAQVVESIGNSKSVNKIEILKTIEHMLK